MVTHGHALVTEVPHQGETAPTSPLAQDFYTTGERRINILIPYGRSCSPGAAGKSRCSGIARLLTESLRPGLALRRVFSGGSRAPALPQSHP